MDYLKLLGIDIPRGGAPTVLDEKKAAVSEKTVEKQRKLDPTSGAVDQAIALSLARTQAAQATAAGGYDRLMAAKKQMQLDATDTFSGDPVTDLTLGVGAGATTVGSSLVGLALTGLGELGELDNDPDALLPGLMKSASRAVMAGGDEIAQNIRGKQSTRAQLGRERAQLRSAEDAAEFAATRAQNEAAGGNETWEGIKEFGKNVGSGAARTIQDPYNLMTTLAEQVPSLAVGGVAGRAAVSAAAVERLALKMATKAGTQVTPALRAAAATSLGAIPERISEGLQEGAGALQQATVEIESQSIEDLATQYKVVRDQLAQGVDEDTIREQLIETVGTRAALTQGLFAATVGGMSSRFDVDPLNAAGRGFIADAAKEAGEELLQSGGGQLAVNEAKLSAGNEQTELLDDVGQAAGQGAALGAGMVGAVQGTAGALQAAPYIPAAIGAGIKTSMNVLGPVLKATGSVASKATAAAVQGAGKLAEGRAERKRAAVSSEARAQQAAQRTQEVDAVRTTIDKINTDGMDVKLDLSTAAEQLTPDDVAGFSEQSLEALDQLAVYSMAVDQITDPDFDPVAGKNYLAYVVQSQDAMRRLRRQTEAQLSTVESETARADLMQLNQKLQGLLTFDGLDVINELKADLPQFDEATLQAITNNVKGAATEALDPSIRNAAETVRALVMAGRVGGLSSSQIEGARILAQASRNPDEYEQRALLQASYIAKENERHEAEVAGRKTIKRVGTEIRDNGFEFMGRKLNSLQDFTDEIMGLTGFGQLTSAKTALEHLGKWAEHATRRVGSFNEAALTQLDKSSPEAGWANRVDMPYRQLKLDGQSLDTEKNAFADLSSDGGVELGVAMEEDARTIVRTFNHLRGLLPLDQQPAALPEIENSPWKARFDAVKDSIPLPSSKPQAEQAPASKETASEAAPKPVVPAEAPQAPEAKAEDKAPGTGERAGDGEQVSSEAKKTLNVWYGTGENAEFSNLADRPFEFKGLKFFSVEHAYQTLKAGVIDRATYEKYKSAGQKIVGAYKAKTKDDFNLRLMRALVKASFEQNPAARDALLATGDAQFTHTQDKGVWATAFPEALMAVREELKANGKADAPKSRVTADQAKRLDDAALNDRLNELVDKRAQGTASEQDDATFTVLNDEMTEREDRVAAEQTAEAEADIPPLEKKPVVRFWHGVRVVDDFTGMAPGEWKLFNDGYEDTFAFNYLTPSGEQIAGGFMVESDRLTHFNIASRSGEGGASPAILRHVLRQLTKTFPEIKGVDGFRISGVRQGREQTAISYQIRNDRLVTTRPSNQEESTGQVPVEISPLAIDFNDPTPASEQQMEDALSLSEDDYIEAVSGGKVTKPTKAAAIREELAGTVAPDDAVQIAEVEGTDVVLMANGNYIYAVDPTQKDEDGDPLTVGLLVHHGDYTILMVHPDSNYRGKGIGQALMRELLVRKPMAQSNGLSPAAKKLRLKVLRQLRAERNVPVFGSLDERFPGLIKASPKGTGPRAENRFLAGFKLNARSKSLFARVTQPLTALSEAIGKGLGAIRELAGFERELVNEDLRALRIFNALAGKLVAQLDATLDAQFQKHWKRLEARDDAYLWNAADRMAFHLGERYVDDQGVERMRMQPQIAEGIVSGGLRHLIDSMNRPKRFDEEEVGKLFPDNIIPPEFREQFQNNVAYAAEASQLARAITDTLAISGNSAITETTVKGLPAMMAASFMEAMTALGLINAIELGPKNAFLESEAWLKANITSSGAKEALETLQRRRAEMNGQMFKFIEMPKDENSILVQFNNALGGSSEILDALFGGFNESRASIGKPAGRVNTKVKGVNVEAGTKQIQMLKVLGKIPQYNNGILQDLFDKIPADLQLLLLGEVPYDEANTGAADLDRLRGLRISAQRTQRELNRLQARLNRYAATAKKDPAAVGVFWNYRVNSNGRAEQQGFGGQNNKWARELWISGGASVDLNNEADMRDYWLSLAQALGVKVENQVNTLSAEEVQAMLDGKLLPLLTRFVEIQESGEITDAPGLVQEFLAQGFGNPARAFNALQTHARFLLHPDASKPFEHGLVFEVDGKTDGPINALMHFGLTHLGPHMLRQLAQGGLILDQTKGDTLNENYDKLNPDLYSNPIREFNDRLKALLVSDKLPAPVKEAFFNSTRGLWRAGRLKASQNEDGNIVIEALRNLFKNPFTQKTYGAGDRSIMVATAKEVASEYAQLINAALQAGKLLPESTVREIQIALGRSVRYSRKNDRYWTVDVPVMRLKTLEDYKAFRIFPSNLDALISQYTQGVGAIMAATINEEMAPVDHTLGILFRLTAMQAAAFSFEFNRLYQARRAELIAADELGPEDGLSQEEARKIMAQLGKLEPKAHTSQTEGGHGITFLKGFESAPLPTAPGKKGRDARNVVQAVGVNGSYSTDIDVTYPNPESGVRIAALLVQAAGDASMMGEVFQEIRTWFNVFDGLEVLGGQLDEASRIVNKAVWDNWMYDVLGSIEQQYAQFDFDFETMDGGALTALFKSIRLPFSDREVLFSDPDEPTRAELVGYFNDQKGLLLTRLQRARDITNAVKQAMSELRSATDHMSGPMAPHIREGLTFDGPEELLKHLQDRVTQILGYSPENFSYKLEKEQVEDATGKLHVAPKPKTKDLVQIGSEKSDEPVPAVKELTGAAVRKILDKHKFRDPVTGFVFARIRKMIPDNLPVLYGTFEDLKARMERTHPHIDLGEPAAGYFIPGPNPVILMVKEGDKQSFNAETLLHELVHAVSTHAIHDYYNNKSARLTRGQKDGVRDLEKLALEFLIMAPEKMPYGFAMTQDIMRTFRDAGDLTNMVSEFLAYSLTSPAISRYLQTQKGLAGIRALGQRLVNALRNLLGLPDNAPVNSFLAQTIDQLGRVSTKAVPYVSGERGLFAQASRLRPDPADGTLDHEEHLDELLERLEDAMGGIPELAEEISLLRAANPGTVVASRSELRMAGARAATKMTKAGFDLSPKQKMIFMSVHAVITGIGTLDPLALSEIQDVHQQVMKQLTLRDMTDNNTEPNSGPDVTAAERRLEALRFSDGKDVFGRSELLANFVALAMVHEPLRKRLADMRMQSQKIERDSFDSLLRSGARKLFDLAGGTILKTWNRPQQQVLDEMLGRVLMAQKQASAAKPSQAWGLVDKAEEWTKGVMHRGYRVSDAAATRLESARAAGDDSLKNSAALVGTNLVSMLLAPESEGEHMARSMTRLLNTSQSSEFIRSIGNELMGTNDGNREIHRLLNQAKMHVSQIRQRLRDQVPRIVMGLFGRPMSKQQMKLLYRTVGRTDAQALLGAFTTDQIADMLQNPANLQAAIAGMVGALPPAMARHLDLKARSLGQYLSTQSTVGSDKLLARNAEAILLRTEKETGIAFTGSADERTQQIQEIDRLVSLYALSALSRAEQEQTAALFAAEGPALEKTLRMLRSIRDIELQKAPDNIYRLNTWKGYLPSTLDPRKDLVLASSQYGEELLKRGYEFVRPYEGDRHDSRSNLGYYASKWSGGLSTYNQGALQTVENSLMGIDVLTGQTLDPAARMLISNPDEVESITLAKLLGMPTQGPLGRGPQLLPIFDQNGDVVAYERPVDPVLLQQTMRQEGHLADAIGMWLGRQAEENLASDLNNEVVKALHARWIQDKANGIADEYVRFDGGTRTAVVKDTWETLPRHLQEQLVEQFGADGVMVRADLKDNALGYRAASVADIFSGTSNISPETRKALENIAFALAGKRAYPLLVTAERSWQGLVGTAKDIIVVRSGVVAVANLLANQLQLLQMTGWSPARLLRVQLAAAKELEHYLRNRSRITEITAALSVEQDQDAVRTLQVEMQSLLDANSRLSIIPLLDAGMLPTIAEGLTEQDQYTLLHDGMRWVEEKAEKLPKGVLTAAKYAVIAKDTALYQGLNRMVQFGDFMAKAALYQALQEKVKAPKNSEAEWRILDEVNESFVNYNLLAGRGRDYLENMGVTWFWNYKLRIQKIALRNFKRNPLRFMGMGVGAEWLGTDSLLSSSVPMINWEYSVGPDQLWRAHQMLLWRTLMM